MKRNLKFILISFSLVANAVLGGVVYIQDQQVEAAQNRKLSDEELLEQTNARRTDYQKFIEATSFQNLDNPMN